MSYSKNVINLPICSVRQSTDSMTYRGKVAGIQIYHTKHSTLTCLIVDISWLPYHLALTNNGIFQYFTQYSK